MRLWHIDLLPVLPRMQILSQHREAAALRGLGWNKPHATVNYVFEHEPEKLFAYHLAVMEEMKRRGYKPDSAWFDPRYRGKSCTPYESVKDIEIYSQYPEHDGAYLIECLSNLKRKIDSAPSGKYKPEEIQKLKNFESRRHHV
jgi:uncharacterized protein (TIGR02328 family)